MASAKARPATRVFGGKSAVSSARKQRDLPPGRLVLDGSDRLRPEPARRDVDDPPEGLVAPARSSGVAAEAQQRERILDFGALVEADVADEDVGDAGAHQRLLEAARQGVAAVEDRDVVPAATLGVPALDLGDDAERLGFGVAEADDLDRIADRAFG